MRTVKHNYTQPLLLLSSTFIVPHSAAGGMIREEGRFGRQTEATITKEETETLVSAPTQPLRGVLK